MPRDEAVWDHSVFSKNRERLLNEEIAQAFFQRVLKLAQRHLSDEPFTVDGTLIEAWASQKSFRPKDEASTFGPAAMPFLPSVSISAKSAATSATKR